MTSIVLMTEYPDKKPKTTALKKDVWLFYEITDVNALIRNLLDTNVSLAFPLPCWLEHNLYIKRNSNKFYLYVYGYFSDIQKHNIVYIHNNVVILFNECTGVMQVLDKNYFTKNYTT